MQTLHSSTLWANAFAAMKAKKRPLMALSVMLGVVPQFAVTLFFAQKAQGVVAELWQLEPRTPGLPLLMQKLSKFVSLYGISLLFVMLSMLLLIQAVILELRSSGKESFLQRVMQALRQYFWPSLLLFLVFVALSFERVVTGPVRILSFMIFAAFVLNQLQPGRPFMQVVRSALTLEYVDASRFRRFHIFMGILSTSIFVSLAELLIVVAGSWLGQWQAASLSVFSFMQLPLPVLGMSALALLKTLLVCFFSVFLEVFVAAFFMALYEAVSSPQGASEMAESS